MNVFNYDCNTGEILFESIADKSPLEPDVFLVPAYATNIKPPVKKDGFSRVFKNGAWEYIKDMRGQVFWLPDGTEKIIDFLGDAPEDALFEKPIFKPTAEQIIQGFVGSIQKHLDDFAKTRGYDGIMSACTYATSTVAKFKTEGQYCVQARDATWSTAYDLLDQVQTGEIDVPTEEEVFESLPTLAWPN